jgi:hypothetical protein
MVVFMSAMNIPDKEIPRDTSPFTVRLEVGMSTKFDRSELLAPGKEETVSQRDRSMIHWMGKPSCFHL